MAVTQKEVFPTDGTAGLADTIAVGTLPHGVWPWDG